MDQLRLLSFVQARPPLVVVVVADVAVERISVCSSCQNLQTWPLTTQRNQ